MVVEEVRYMLQRHWPVGRLHLQHRMHSSLPYVAQRQGQLAAPLAEHVQNLLASVWSHRSRQVGSMRGDAHCESLRCVHVGHGAGNHGRLSLLRPREGSRTLEQEGIRTRTKFELAC